MGFVFSKIWNSVFGKGEMRIIILGLDNAGKTTLLYKLQLNEIIQTIPTIGFNVETVTYKNLKFQVWDLGGQGSIRPYWRCYYPNTNAIIYIIDSIDRDRIESSRNEMMTMLSEEDLVGVPLLVLANKQDLPGAMSEVEISEKLGLTNITDRQWNIFKTSVIKNENVAESFDWVASILSAN